MNALDIIHAEVLKKEVPDLKPGMTVKVYQRIKEGDKERTQMFEGVILAVGSGTGFSKTFTVRKVVDGIGVEKVYPLYGSTIEKIVITKTAKVRRAKLYYLRNAIGKAARLKETVVKTAKVVKPAKMAKDEGIKVTPPTTKEEIVAVEAVEAE